MGKTIAVSEESLNRWKTLKNHPQESYEDMINRIISYIQDDDELTPKDLKDIQEALDDFKAGRVHTLEEVKKMHGLK